MSKDANDTIREALVAGLRDALEPESQNGAGRSGASRATKLAAGAALAAAATPVAKRGATTLRTSSGGRVLRMAVDRSGLPERAARRIADANRAVQDWTARQQQKRDVLTDVPAAEPRQMSSKAADERDVEPATHPERIERFGRQARASRMWTTPASSRRNTTNASPPQRAEPSRPASVSRKSGSSPKARGSTRAAHSASGPSRSSSGAAWSVSDSARRSRARR